MKPRSSLSWIHVCTVLAFLVMPACKGDKGDQGPPGTSVPDPTAPPRGLVAKITDLFGASGTDGSFQVGDTITVRFTIHDKDGKAYDALSDLDRGRAMVSGPTFNYHRVIPSQSDVLDRGVKVGEGTFDYAFPVPIPAVYEPPFNDSSNFTIGEMTGEALLAGTYTVGLEMRVVHETADDSIRTPQTPTMDFRFGGAPALEPRAVVASANCNQCHGELRFHGNNRNRAENCVLCHTAGMESSESAVPVTLDFKVLIHKLHAGKHLPSVLGVTTNTDGSRKYDATPIPYDIGGHDFSEIGFPRWPSLAAPMPRDVGYTALTSTEQGLENTMRSAPVDCDSCHGDPDGSGELEAPANGDLIYSQPSRLACGSCHDDWVWDRPYTSNLQTMPLQSDDSACVLCHKESGNALAVREAHLHPLLDTSFAKGTNFVLQSIVEAGSNNGDGTFDPGEKMRLTFTIKDDAGNDIDPAQVSRFELLMSGPTENPNLVLFTSVPTAGLASSGTHAMNAPERVHLEYVGNSTVAGGEMFGTARIPHWNIAGASTEVSVRTGVNGSSSLVAAVPAFQNYVDVQPGAGASFARNDYIVIEDGVAGQQEYLRAQFVEGDRLWFSSPATSSYAPHTRVAHGAGASVQSVNLAAKTEGVDYTLDPVNGVITEVLEFGTGAVIVEYTTDFVVPTAYGGPSNESPDLDESWGEWRGKSLVDGTYTVGLWASRSITFNAFGEDTGYREAARAATLDVLVGNSSEISPNQRISSAQNCYSCHGDLTFHGSGRRDYASCVLCHSQGGAEDRAKYVAANAPNNGVTIDFRTMLHKIHQGKELVNAANYAVAGFGVGYPNNFSLHHYDGVGFPHTPGGTSNCTSCHGEDNTAWLAPAGRDHPTEQVLPVRVWRASCNSCHDSSAATAHIEANTAPSGAESCELCHGPGKLLDVETAHRIR